MMMQAAAPGLFTTSAQGSGQVFAFHKADMSCNGQAGPKTIACPNGTRPAHSGETLMLFLTGQGAQSGGPSDGTVATSNRPNDSGPFQVWIGGGYVPPENVLFSGVPAGAVAGLWEIDVKVHDNVVPGLLNPIFVIYRDVPSEFGGVPNTTVIID
jgi:uncharacterized protein (TIGR03437 family)